MTVDIATLGIRIDSREALTAAQSLERMRESGVRAEQQAASLDVVTRKLSQALQLLGVGAGVGAIIRMADEYTKFNAQIKLATQSQREYAAAVDDVRRIATTAQQDLAATGTLYARIANGTRELGVQQKQVAAITETVNLALKVSGATAAESASAQLQLSQAFASGTLRGEEFNAVNEAAPRLMKALADGMGVPIGALREMASEGKITSQIMSNVLPGALEQLREEAKQVQTIGGAFAVLKNSVMEFIGTQAQASGSVAVLTGAIGLLADNLNVLAGVALTLTAVKLVNWLVDATQAALAKVAANRALAAANLATAQSDYAAAAAADRVAQARVLELRAAVLAADGNVALAITTNGLIPAEQNAIRTTTALTASYSALTVAQRAASASSAAVSAAVGFLGGPLGAIITVLGVAATAWSWYSSKADQANKDAATSTEESHEEMVVRLTKQIELLRERAALLQTVPKVQGANQADIDGLARRKAELDAIQQGTGRWAGESASARQMAEIDAAFRYQQALNLVTTAQKEVKAATEGTKAQKIAKWYGENGSAAQRLAYELDKLKKEFGEVPAAMEAALRAKYIDKDGAAVAKANVAANLEAVKSGIDHERNLRAEGIARIVELNRQGLASDTEVFNAKHAAALAAGKDAAAAFDAEIAALSAYNGKDAAARIANNAKIKDLGAQRTEALRASLVAAEQLANAYAYDKDKPAREAEATAQKEIVAINDQIDATQRQIAAYNKLPSAISEAAIAQLEEQKAALASFEGNEKAVAAIDSRIAAYKRLAEEQKTLQGLDAGTDVAKAEQLLKILQAVDEAARQAAQGMEDSFGRVGAAIGGLTTALTGYAVQQQAIAAQLATIKADPKNSAEKVAKAEAAAAKASAQAQIKSYGDMASAAKGFFGENSKGYKALEAAEKTYRAFEMAMAVQSMVQKLFAVNTVTAATVSAEVTKTAAVEAGTAAQLASDMVKGTSAAAVGVATQAQGDPYSAWARMAAMAAAMAALGFAVSGGSGGSGKSVAQIRQEAQGTGSIFGDSTAKSDSIKRALEATATNSSIELDYTRGMLASLRSIESSMSGLGNLLVRTSGLTSTTFTDQESSAKSLYMSMQPFWSIGAGTVGKWVSSVFGGKKTVEDTGFTIDPTTLAAAMGGNINSFQYAQIKKDGGWFHSDKTTIEKSALGDAADAQFAKVINSLGTSVSEAAKLLGLGGDAFTAKLNSFVIDIGKISLKGLSGEEIQEQLESVFSKLGDDMAQFGVGGLEQFQKVGEGYFETLTRVATNYANLDSILAASGATFGQTGLASIAARERLIALAGGIDDLASHQSSFNDNFLTQAERLAPVQKYVTDQLAAMGLQSLDTRDKFKDYVLGLTESGALLNTTGDITQRSQEQYVALLALADAFAKTHAATVDLTKSEQEIRDERADLQNQLDQLTMTSDQLRAKERKTIDASNLALFDQITARQKLSAAYSAESDARASTIASLTSAIESYKKFSDGLVLGSLSTLTPLQKLAQAQQQYENTLAAAKAGDTAAQANLATAANTYLTADQVVKASSDAYAADFAKVQADMAAVAAAAVGQLSDAQKQQASLDALVKGWISIDDSIKAGTTSVVDAIAALQLAGGTQVDGSHASGLSRVPFDGYIAELHEGEQVLTASQALDYRSMGTSNMGALVAEIRSLRASHEAALSELKELRAGQGKQTAAIVASNFEANEMNAEKINEGAKAAAKEGAYVANNPTWKEPA